MGKEVRAAIKRIGGTMPEQIPSAEHIKEVKKRLESVKPKLALDGREAGGLLGNIAKKSKKEQAWVSLPSRAQTAKQKSN